MATCHLDPVDEREAADGVEEVGGGRPLHQHDDGLEEECGAGVGAQRQYEVVEAAVGALGDHDDAPVRPGVVGGLQRPLVRALVVEREAAEGGGRPEQFAEGRQAADVEGAEGARDHQVAVLDGVGVLAVASCFWVARYMATEMGNCKKKVI